MKKQYFLLFLLFCLFCSNFSFSQSIENLIDYPNQINSISITNANNIWVLTSSGEVLKTDYLFRNFEPVYKSNKFGFDIKFYDENTGYCLGFADTVFTTTDAGKNWNSIIINKKNRVLYTLSNFLFINKDEMLLNCIKFNNITNNHIDVNNFNGVIIKKTNDDFKEVFSYPKGSINKIYSYNNIYYAVGSNNLILRSYDQGSTWTLPTTKNECVYNDVLFLNENTGYFVGSKNDEGFLAITYDGCKTWVYKEIPNSKNLRSIYSVNKDSFIILGNENKIYCTNNGCEYFSKIELNNDINTNLYNFYALDSKNLLFLATHSIENEDKEIISSNTSVYKLDIDKFFNEYSIKLSPEKYKNELIAFMQTAAEKEASSAHPVSKIEKTTKKKISESLEENKSLTEEYEFSVNMRGAILGINEYLVKIKIIGKLEFNILGEPKHFIKETKIIYDKKK
jgi:photosystem II stability/assembly factor-like uncharacterized protein